MHGTPGRNRTCNHFLRTELLYPIELPGHTTAGVLVLYRRSKDIYQLLGALTTLPRTIGPWAVS